MNELFEMIGYGLLAVALFTFAADCIARRIFTH